MSWFAGLKRFWNCFFAPADCLQRQYRTFRIVLDFDRSSHRALARLEGFYHNGKKVDFCAVRKTYGELATALAGMLENLDRLAPGSHRELFEVFRNIDSAVQSIAAGRLGGAGPPYVLPLHAVESEAADLTGTKAANLARIGNDLKLPVPRGFVITTKALQYFLEKNNLSAEIEARLAALDIESSASLASTSRELTALIEAAPLPADLSDAIVAAADLLMEQCQDATGVCVRSSAEQEDSGLSFAGQYRTVLHVKPARLIEAYKKVIASKYSPSALVYRVANGLLEEETRMAVLVLEMVEARASGVLYTRNPLQHDRRRLVIYSIWGLGEMLVRGAAEPDVLEISREQGLPVVRKQVASKPRKGVLAVGEGFTTAATPAEEINKLSLDEQSARQLAEWGLQLEAYFGAPQDVEWCRNQQGNLYVLQSRPLREETVENGVCEAPVTEIPDRILLDQGEKVASGVGTGTVVKVGSASELGELPEQTVLVAPSASPEFAKVIGKLRAVVTDGGSIAGHFASVARERGIPALANTRIASQVLQAGQIVTVDADRQMVFAGTVTELSSSVCGVPDAVPASPFRQRLRRMLDWISPLHLTDPRDPGFTASNCQSLHDILRFAHEKAVQEMFALSDRKTAPVRSAKRLESEIPIVLYVMNLGNGLFPHALPHKVVKLADIANPSLRALWRGLEHPSLVWSPQLRHLDWHEFDRVSAGIMRLDTSMLASFALISREYLNINIRFGYHFVVLDCWCGEEAQLNYISMRFEGGGGGFGGRYLRVLFLSRVLQHHGFKVYLEGDRLEARLRRVSSTVLQERMAVAGRLLGFTRLLDIRLTDEAQVTRLVDEFILTTAKSEGD